jgi:hypothetical protein
MFLFKDVLGMEMVMAMIWLSGCNLGVTNYLDHV